MTEPQRKDLLRTILKHASNMETLEILMTCFFGTLSMFNTTKWTVDGEYFAPQNCNMNTTGTWFHWGLQTTCTFQHNLPFIQSCRVVWKCNWPNLRCCFFHASFTWIFRVYLWETFPQWGLKHPLLKAKSPFLNTFRYALCFILSSSVSRNAIWLEVLIVNWYICKL